MTQRIEVVEGGTRKRADTCVRAEQLVDSADRAIEYQNDGVPGLE
jgi:hypothetical protein